MNYYKEGYQKNEYLADQILPETQSTIPFLAHSSIKSLSFKQQFISLE